MKFTNIIPFVLILLLIQLIPFSNAQYVPSAGLVSAYNFQDIPSDGSTLTDRVGPNFGISHSVLNQISGPFQNQKAWSLSNGRFVTVGTTGDNSWTKNSNSFSLTAWVNPSFLNASTNNIVINDEGAFSVNLVGSPTHFFTVTANLWTSSNCGATVGVTSAGDASTDSGLNQWSAFALTYDGSTFSVYAWGPRSITSHFQLNGASATGTICSPASTTQQTFGSQYLNNVTSNPYNGALANVRFYNTALIHSQVDSAWNQTGGIVDSCAPQCSSSQIIIKGCTYDGFSSKGTCDSFHDLGVLNTATVLFNFPTFAGFVNNCVPNWLTPFSSSSSSIANITDINGVTNFTYFLSNTNNGCFETFVISHPGYITQNYTAFYNSGNITQTFYIPLLSNNNIQSFSLNSITCSPYPGNFTIPSAANISISFSITQTSYFSIARLINNNPTIITPINTFTPAGFLNYTVTYPFIGYSQSNALQNDTGAYAVVISNSSSYIQIICPFVIANNPPFLTQFPTTLISNSSLQNQLFSINLPSAITTGVSPIQNTESQIQQATDLAFASPVLIPNMYWLLIVCLIAALFLRRVN